MHRPLLLCSLLALAACGGGGRMAYGPGQASYPEPGPPGDPWRPYIRTASSRFSVPQTWIRAVMQQESGGHEYRNGQPITSAAGAMGLMQLMPATYADMQSQNSLGSDPYEPHDNILAGTAYIRLMYVRYGAPAFLAAYNAGPQRLDDYLGSGRRLPNETVNYVASITPHLGTEIAMTGPLSADAAATARRAPAAASPIRLVAYRAAAPVRRADCYQDPDAAYDPDAACRPAPMVVRAPVYRAAALARRADCYRDPDAAYDPDAACLPAPGRTQVAAVAAPMVRAPAFAAPAFVAPPGPAARVLRVAALPAYGSWAIQVGAYTSEGQAHFAATMARQAAYTQLSGSRSLVQPTSRFGGSVLYRARLAGLARNGAGAACNALEQHSIPCMIVAPGG